MENEKQQLFIKTRDQETKQKLLDLGFKLITENMGEAVFLNDAHIRFDRKSMKGAVYSDKVFI